MKFLPLLIHILFFMDGIILLLIPVDSCDIQL